MTEYIKLTDKNMQTRGGYQYTIGKTHRPPTPEPDDGEPCQEGYLHAYESLEQAAMMAPVHGLSNYTRAFVVTGKPRGTDGTKLWFRRLKMVREVEPLKLTTEQRVAVAIVLVCRCYRASEYLDWARKWLSGEGRSAEDAASAADAAWAASAAAAWASLAVARAAARSAAAAAAWAVARAAARSAKDAAAAAWRVARYGHSITDAVRLVLSTPEAEWPSLIEVE
jgi:anthranilate phosphoribosyltransferase